ncbi:MAG: RNA polymerase sigma-70 factor [Proteobacteria bacterium]|nr:RNA polymerase sigma-70 factor [Pseudomonadota bacterium]
MVQRNSHDNAAEYIRSFQNGEEKGFNFFFREYYAALTYYSFSIIKDKSEAEEIAGEALMKLWKRHENFNNQAAIKSFLYTTTRNASLNYIRQQQRTEKKLREAEYLAEKSEKDIFEFLVEVESYREIVIALNALPPQCKKIFSMLFIEGKDYQQIAEELNLSIATIRSQKARAIMLIRQYIAYCVMLFLLLHSF